jgi:hypothetical protein
VSRSEVHRGITLIWTLCERDVPANAAYKCDGDDVTCSTCALIQSLERLPKARAS